MTENVSTCERVGNIHRRLQMGGGSRGSGRCTCLLFRAPPSARLAHLARALFSTVFARLFSGVAVPACAYWGFIFSSSQGRMRRTCTLALEGFGGRCSVMPAVSQLSAHRLLRCRRPSSPGCGGAFGISFPSPSRLCCLRWCGFSRSLSARAALTSAHPRATRSSALSAAAVFHLPSRAGTKGVATRKSDLRS